MEGPINIKIVSSFLLFTVRQFYPGVFCVCSYLGVAGPGPGLRASRGLAGGLRQLCLAEARPQGKK